MQAGASTGNEGAFVMSSCQHVYPAPFEEVDTRCLATDLYVQDARRKDGRGFDRACHLLHATTCHDVLKVKGPDTQ